MKRLWFIIFCILFLLPITVLGCFSENPPDNVVAEFSIPEITARYQEIIIKYGLKVNDSISEQEVEELFAILQVIKNDPNIQKTEGAPYFKGSRYYIFLERITMTKQPDGIIIVITSSHSGITSSYGNFLYFKRSLHDTWYLTIKSQWIS